MLYEMLAGRRTFQGDDISTTLAAIMMKEPDWAAVPAAGPTGLRRLLRSGLEEDPRRRLQAIGDARLDVERAARGTPDEAVAVAPVASPRWQRVLP